MATTCTKDAIFGRVVIGAICLSSADPSKADVRSIDTATDVPFVGCKSDGQQGPQKAPDRHSNVKAPRWAARRLAYYQAADGPGILAPRGWRCIGLYGSAGTVLIVTPSAHRAGAFFGSAPFTTTEPAVVLGYNYGGTSGRWAVAKAIARYFPEHRGFIRDNFQGLEVGPLPTGPAPNDLVRYTTRTRIRFTTPPRQAGQGTAGFLAPSPRPIDGLVALVPNPDGPDLLEVDVRLPKESAGLTSVIVDAAQDTLPK